MTVVSGGPPDGVPGRLCRRYTMKRPVGSNHGAFCVSHRHFRNSTLTPPTAGMRLNVKVGCDWKK
jgi:hypothetical protein